MKPLHLASTGLAALLLAACGGAGTGADGDAGAPDATVAETPDAAEPAAAALIPELEGVAAATYSLEPNHAFLIWSVGHSNGLSQYRVNFTDFDADLVFDPSNPEASQLTVTINPMAVSTVYPGDYQATHEDSPYETWEEDIARNERWLNADAHPEITFTSTAIERTGDTTGQVTGDLSFRGTTRPVTLDVTFNGSANMDWFGERDVIGFEARGTLNRSDFGSDAFIPMISDEVRIEFTGEFLQDEA